MTHVNSRHIFAILLPNPVDGQKIEDFLTRFQLRSDEVRITSSDTNDEFLTGKPYWSILVGSDSPPPGREKAIEVAKEFNGFLI